MDEKKAEALGKKHGADDAATVANELETDYGTEREARSGWGEHARVSLTERGLHREEQGVRAAYVLAYETAAADTAVALWRDRKAAT